MRRITNRARITKPISPHILRHGFLTAALVPRDIQEAASHADPRTTMGYDRGHSLTVDRGCREVADSVLSWLKGKGL